MLIYTANMDVSTVLTPPSSPTCASQHYECAVCKILYKTKSGLMHHNTIVRKYNLKHEGLCRLPSEVITEFKAFLVNYREIEWELYRRKKQFEDEDHKLMLKMQKVND
ncbi:21692_t:CDS:2 [Entrophospora sp. SA101]|nr:21692_t:CDS:2 [Entrophospora sp. SA101]